MKRRATTQDISWFLDLNANGQLELDPPFQRRSVWSTKDRQYFLDTIFRGYPSPAIFVHKVTRSDGRHTHEVVDGKQRLETILSFHSNKLAIGKEFGDTTLDGKKWKDLSTEQRGMFWDYVVPVEFLSHIDGDLVKLVFDRLNRNARRLQAQELRHARFDGWFINLAESEADTPFWADLRVSTTARRKRMKDVQFVSECLIAVIEDSVRGFDQLGLDVFYAAHESLDESEPPIDDDQLQVRISTTKKTICQIEAANGSISIHARTFTNFYSLWCAITLGQIEFSEAIATKYAKHMDAVAAAKKGATQAVDADAAAYHEASSGASTELPQRQQRHDVLLRVFG